MRRPSALLVAAIAVLALPAAGPLAAGGTLDTSFDGDGKLVLDATEANAVAVRADGKMAVVGGGGAGFTVVRLNANGSLDTTFDGDGRVSVVVGDLNDNATAVAFDADGKLVVAGTAQADFAAIRLNDDGSLDTTFDGDGKQRVSIGPGSFDVAYRVAVDAAGRILLGGGSEGDFALLRLTAAGAPDTTFGGDGTVTTDFAGFPDEIHGLAVQPDGKVVAAGPAYLATRDFGVVRYLDDGSLDPSFDGDGRATVDFGADDTAWGLALASGGRIVVGGYTGACCSYDFVAARLNADGSPDTGFSGDGRSAALNLGGADIAFDVAVDGSDRVVLAGSVEAGGDFDWGIARLAADGTPDAGFGTGGIVSSPFAVGFARAFGVAVQADGRYVVAGAAEEGGASGAGVARFLAAAANAAPTAAFTVAPASGTTDTTFSFAGGGSSDPDGDALSYSWTFGDGAVGSGAAVTHRYAAAGTYTVRLTVDDGRGGTDSTVRNVAVSAPSPTPSPTPSPSPSPSPAPSPSPSPTPSPSPSPTPGPGSPVSPEWPRRVELEVRTTGKGAGVVRGGSGAIDCGARCTATFAGGDTVVLRAVPTRTSVFRGWGGACRGVGSTCELTLARAAAVTARFERRGAADPYTLAVLRPVGGAVASWEWGLDGEPIDCGVVCVNQFRRATVVRLVAVPRPGFEFGGWSGACEGQPAWCTVRMTGPRTAAAVFVSAVPSLAVTVSGSGSVASWDWGVDDERVDCGESCLARYPEGAVVRLVAVPAPGFDFVRWTGACSGQGAWCTLTMSAARATHASFVSTGGGSR